MVILQEQRNCARYLEASVCCVGFVPREEGHMRKKIFGILGWILWLSGAVLIASGGEGCMLDCVNPPSVRAAKSSKDIQKEIDDQNERQQSAEEEKRQLEKEIADMESDKKDALSYLKSLDDKQQELSERMQDNREGIQSAKKKVKQLRREKKKAAAEKKKQYDTMKKRIKYMYENGSEGYLELLAGSRSLSELFNRAEYVTKVSSYDRNLLRGFQKLQRQIQKAEDEIQKNLKTLTNRRESLQVEESSMNHLMAKKEQEVKRVQNLLDNKSDALKDTEVLLASQEEELERMMAAQRAAAEREEAARQAQAKKEKQDKRDSQSKSPGKKNDGDHNAATSAPNSQRPGSTGGYCWPLAVSGRISSYFGNRTSPTAGASSYHKGIDISVPVGTGILAAKDGLVVTAAYSSTAGNYVAISHGGGIYTYYMHCSSLNVSVGQQVAKGQKIAQSGNTGISTGPHLHFAVFAGGSYVNPLNYVSQ